MKSLVSLVLALWTMAAWGQEVPRFGKTDRQILAMGRERFRDFYISKNGDNKESEWNADELFLRAMKLRNDGMLAGNRGANVSRAREIRPKLYALFVKMLEIGKSIQPGGYWRGAEHDNGIQIETAVFAILMRTPHPKIVYVSAFEKCLPRIEQNMRESRKDNPEIDPAAFQIGIQQAKKMYAEIVRSARDLPTAGSSWVLGYCRDLAVWVGEGYL